MNLSWTIYRQLARAFPHEFKMAFGEDMLLAGEESMRRLTQRRSIAGFFRILFDAA
jgi:hypothetical protein